MTSDRTLTVSGSVFYSAKAATPTALEDNYSISCPGLVGEDEKKASRCGDGGPELFNAVPAGHKQWLRAAPIV